MPASNTQNNGKRGNGRVSYVSTAYETIKRNILSNQYPPGHHALEQELADELEMSRTPVREALIRLANEGLVELIPRRGMRVIPLSPDDMKELYEVIGGLENVAIELIGERDPGPDAYAVMLQATEAMDAALQEDDLETWAQQDTVFHQEILNLSGNALLKSIVHSLNDKVHRARSITLRLRPKPVNSTQEHREMVEALVRGDVEEARRIHAAHRSNAAKVIIEQLMYYRLNQV